MKNCNSNLTFSFFMFSVSSTLPQLQCRYCIRDSRPTVAWAEWRRWHHRSPAQPSICPRCHDNVGLRRGAHRTRGESGNRMRKECCRVSYTPAFGCDFHLWMRTAGTLSCMRGSVIREHRRLRLQGNLHGRDDCRHAAAQLREIRRED